MQSDDEVSVERRKRIVLSIDAARVGDKQAAEYCCRELLLHLKSGKPLPKSLAGVLFAQLEHIAAKDPLALFPGARKPAGRPRSRLPEDDKKLQDAMWRVWLLIDQGYPTTQRDQVDSAFQIVGAEMGPDDEEERIKWVQALEVAYRRLMKRPDTTPIRRILLEY